MLQAFSSEDGFGSDFLHPTQQSCVFVINMFGFLSIMSINVYCEEEIKLVSYDSFFLSFLVQPLST
jgi:hypothetical protein